MDSSRESPTYYQWTTGPAFPQEMIDLLIIEQVPDEDDDVVIPEFDNMMDDEIYDDNN